MQKRLKQTNHEHQAVQFRCEVDHCHSSEWVTSI